MFFFLSKFLLMVMYPICWIFVLFIYSAVVKNPKTKKRAFLAAFGILYFFSMPFFLNLFVKYWDITDLPKGGKYSAAIVLGGFTSYDNDGNGYFNASADRFIETVKLKDNGTVSKIMMSGGSGLLFKGQDHKEADFVVTQLKAFNIPDSCILSENKSRNTYENALFTKHVLDSNKVKGPYLLVTSTFHMRRAEYIFKKLGLDVIPYPCDPKAGAEGFSVLELLIPSAETLSTWNLYTKEIAGVITYHFKSAPKN